MGKDKKEYELKIMLGGGTDASFKNAFSRAEKEVSSLYHASKRSNQGILKSIDSMDAVANRVFGAVVKGAAAASAGLMGIGTASVVAGSKFEAQMSTVKAISGASNSEMEKLNALAKQMGIDTKFSASEAGKGLEYMAMAGWNTQQMLSGLPGIMDLAAASGEDLGAVSDIVTDAMTAFGLEASRSAEFADVLAQASSKSNTNVGLMGETFQYVAPIAGTLGYTIQDTAVAIGLMANSGLKGQKAGTALRSMMTKLVKPTAQGKAVMDRFKLSVSNADGSMRPLKDTLGDIRKRFAGLSQSEQANAAASLVGQEAMSGLLAIVNTSDKDFNGLTAAIDNSAGAAHEMSEVRLDNLQGDITLLKSSLEGAGIEIYEGLKGPLRSLTKMGTAWVNAFTNDIKKDLPTIRRHVKNLGDGLIQVFGPVLDLGEWFLAHPDVVAGGLAGVATALLMFKAAKGITTGVKLFGKMVGLIKSWPIAIPALIISGIVGITTALDQAAKKRAAENLAEHFGSVALSIEELNEAARHIIGDDLFDNIEGMEASSKKADENFSNMKNSLDRISKIKWKAKVGMAITVDDTQDYVDAVNSYVKGAQDYITEKGYEINLAVKVVFGDSEEGQEFGNSSGAFYQSLLAQLEPLKNGLKEALDTVTEKGFTLDTQKVVQDYLDQIQTITSIINDSESAAKLDAIKIKYTGVELDSDTVLNLQKELNDQSKDALEKEDESFQKVLTSLNSQKSAHEKGLNPDFNEDTFNTQKEAATQAHFDKQGEIIKNKINTMKGIIEGAYGDEIQPELDAFEQRMTKGLQDTLPNLDNKDSAHVRAAVQKVYEDAMQGLNIPPDARRALGQLWQGIEPGRDELEKLKQQSKKATGVIPEGINEGLSEISKIGFAAGDQGSVWYTVGKMLNKDPYRKDVENAFREDANGFGNLWSDWTIDGFKSAYKEGIPLAADDFRKICLQELQKPMSITAPISIAFKTLDTPRLKAPSPGHLEQPTYQTLGVDYKPGGHAEGGIFDTPHIAWFAEAGPEAVVPLNGTPEAASIWQEAGRQLGTYDDKESYSSLYDSMAASSASPGGGNAPIQISYAPVIHVGNDTDKTSIGEQLKMSFEDFKEYMEQYKEECFRVSF